jgi:hypothetical protein
VLGLIFDIPNTPISGFERREKPIAPSFPCDTEYFVTAE